MLVQCATANLHVLVGVVSQALGMLLLLAKFVLTMKCTAVLAFANANCNAGESLTVWLHIAWRTAPLGLQNRRFWFIWHDILRHACMQHVCC